MRPRRFPHLDDYGAGGRCASGALALCLTVVGGGPAHAAIPLSYLSALGIRADREDTLLWGLLIISLTVIFIMGVLVLAGVLLRRSRARMPTQEPLLHHDGGGVWIGVGVGITFLVLLGSVVWTVVVLAEISTPPAKPAFTLEVTAQQWWWKARYLSADPSRTLIVANEFHIPTGVPVRIKLISADVIHSFWVPALGGKLEVIPGQDNYTWIEADKPGVYRGQCTEYCGLEHARMGFYVVAQTPEEFRDWWNDQLKPAKAPQTAEVRQGEHFFVYECGACHKVRGTMAGGTVAPDLTHLMSRHTIAAATLVNNVGTLSGWIENPQAVKPGNHMPTFYLSGPELNELRSFLLTLK